MLHTCKAKVHHLLATIRLGHVDDNLVTNSRAIVAIDVAPDDGNVRLVIFQCQVHENIVESLFDVSRIEVPGEVIGRCAPLSFSSTIDVAYGASGRIGRN